MLLLDHFRIAGQFEKPAHIPNWNDQAQRLVVRGSRGCHGRSCSEGRIDQFRLADGVTGDLVVLSTAEDEQQGSNRRQDSHSP